MPISLEEKNGYSIIILEEEFNINLASELKNKILDLINGKKYHVILDFSKVELINSAGLGLLISATKSLKQNNGSLKIAAINESIEKIFQITKLDTILDIYKDTDSAMK